jgi:hypothetical protein
VSEVEDEAMEDAGDEHADDEPRRVTRSRGTKRTFSELSASEDDDGEGDGEDSEGPSRKKSRAASGTARKIYPTVRDFTSPRNSVTPLNLKRVPLSRAKDPSINKPLHISNISNLPGPDESYAFVVPAAEVRAHNMIGPRVCEFNSRIGTQASLGVATARELV